VFKPNFVLIDFENVQPKNLSILSDEQFQIRLFLGAKQIRLDVGIVETMHQFGAERARYIHAKESGKNALDFYITYYLGQLVAENPQGYFHLISKDKGFDPLLVHLQAEGVKVRRHVSLMDIPIIGVAKNADMTEKTEAALANLKARGSSRPRKEQTLKNTLKHMFKDELNDTDVGRIFQELVKTNRIATNKGKIVYNLSE